jgi:hypothetical protein
MAVLIIFGDEAGTMPEEDDGDVFTAATVSALVQIPTINQPCGQIGWLIEQFKAFDVIPRVAFLKPKPSYGKVIKEKLQKMNTMARTTRLMTATNRDYLTRDGVPLRNYVWLYCMAQSIAQAVVSAVIRTEVHRIEIILDQKTMAVPTRTLFQHQLLKISNQLLAVLKKAREVDSSRATLYETRVKFSSGSISLCWSDETCASGFEGGLRLAHYLASLYRRGLTRSEEPRIKALLREEGFAGVEMDFTDKLISPLNRKSIQQWEKNTGLREPNPL